MSVSSAVASISRVLSWYRPMTVQGSDGISTCSGRRKADRTMSGFKLPASRYWMS